MIDKLWNKIYPGLHRKHETCFECPAQPQLQTLLDELTAEAGAQRIAPLLAEAENLITDNKFAQAEARLTAVLSIEPDQPEAREALEKLPEGSRRHDLGRYHDIAMVLIEDEKYDEAGRLMRLDDPDALDRLLEHADRRAREALAVARRKLGHLPPSAVLAYGFARESAQVE